MMQLSEFYSGYDHFFLTFERPDTMSLGQKEKVRFATLPARNPFTAAKSFAECIKILREEKPDIIISTGADVGLLACVAAKLLGIKVIFIESFCRPLKPGVSARIAYTFADLFIYQWEELSKYYPKGIFGGSIF